MPMCGLLQSLFRHSLHLITFAGEFAGCTLDRKQRLVTGICFCLSTLAHTSLLFAGGAITDSRYKSSTLIGFRHPVTDRHDWFSPRSRFLA